VYRHALHNALVPVVSVLGTVLPRLLGGAVVTETIFGWPGMGLLAVQSANSRDYPVVMGITVVVAVAVVVSTFLVDMAYTWLDPRIRFQ
jgi:peptide/nickel transport system permease protein